jgi:hypothetical protein
MALKKKISKENIVYTSHFINNFEEIGWITPGGEFVEEQNLTMAKFNVFLYDAAKYVKDFPPLMVYLPNTKVFN